MSSRNHAAAESAWLYRTLTLGPDRILLVGETLRIEYVDSLTEIHAGDIGAIMVRPSWFWYQLTVRLTDGTERSVGGLDRLEAARVRDMALAEVERVHGEAVAEAKRVHEAAVAEAVQRGRALSPRLKRLDEKLRQLFSGERYVRHRDASRFLDPVASIVSQCQGLIGEHLEEGAKEALGRLAKLEFVEELETAREQANSLFVRNNIPRAQAAALKSLPVPLTDEQAEAIATDEEVTLVLAGAGTGKTSVIVGKVAHLVHNQGVSQHEILVLAFNNKAAAQIRERLADGLSTADVYTFHKFGSRVITHSEGISPTISKLATDDFVRTRVVEDILRELLNDSQQSNAVFNFMAYHHEPYRSAFDFDTMAEYNEYVQVVELRTLSGDSVKSFEELAIANYLTEHSIEFRYEEPYKVKTATQHRRQYQPDFFLPDYDIYIEHFALNQKGRPPSGWMEYAEGVEWKRTTHRQYDSKLIETYSWQHRQGTLLPTLHKQLEDVGVEFKRVPIRTLVQQLAQQLISWLARLLAKFLNHVKTSGLTPRDLRVRARETGVKWRSEGFLDIFEQVSFRYQQRLERENTLDFHDLINRAAHYIREGRWKSQYRYVLVDEFQDISAGRMALLEALKLPNMAYFLVGDDWQSIYRFAGSDVSLVRGCGDYLGHVQERTLTQTFRFADGILKPSTAFAQRNPEQTQRELRSASGVEDEGLTVVAGDRPEQGVASALQEIKANARGRRRSILVLGRYSESRHALPTGPLRKGLQVEFSTVHRAKGREADYVVVLDLKDDPWGFPAKIEDDPLLELVLPRASAYEFAEERRLFYVAMTRARIGTYLVADPEEPSVFVEELLRECKDLRQIGELPPECPRCVRGRLVPSESRKNLRCSNYPNCGHLAPRCPNCNVGYALVSEGVAECSNQACEHPPTPCPWCGMGVLQVKDGRHGLFWGCTEYSAEPSCRYTKDIEHGTSGTW